MQLIVNGFNFRLHNGSCPGLHHIQDQCMKVNWQLPLYLSLYKTTRYDYTNAITIGTIISGYSLFVNRHSFKPNQCKSIANTIVFTLDLVWRFTKTSRPNSKQTYLQLHCKLRCLQVDLCQTTNQR